MSWRLLVVAALASPIRAQVPVVPRAPENVVRQPMPTDSTICPDCRQWNVEHQPSRIFGNVYYVGTNGLSSILVTSASGHVLIDGGLPESAPLIEKHIAALGFRLADVKVILNSHAHFDHAGGISLLQRGSGARVVASSESAPVLLTGRGPDGDPQHGLVPNFMSLPEVDIARDRDTISVGNITLTMHATGGHMPGGTSWSWRSCEGSDCVDFVYADSQTPVSNDTFLFSKSARYPAAVSDFEKGFQYLEAASCDVLLTPHPGASSLFERMAKGREGLVDPTACRRYAANARRALEARLAREKGR
jgi:metallo-beta-lactamase class B